MKTIRRAIVPILERRLRPAAPFLQIVVGPRQVGKTTAVQQVLGQWKGESLYATADLPSPPDAYWIQAQWQAARQLWATRKRPVLLALDEVQKVPRWAEVVKALVDDDRRIKRRVRAVLLGSSSLHVQRDAHESLAGRFELHYCPHWTWPECRQAFGWDLDRWIYYGGYPAAASLIKDTNRWKQYISLSLIEAVLSRDVLQMAPIAKPALLRQLFMLAAHNPAQILSYNKMLGQLQDAGNTVTLAHYVRVLGSAFFLSGLNQWAGGLLRERASSPKLVLWNNALISALTDVDFRTLRQDGARWGRWVENAVGAFLLNALTPGDVFYWREKDREVDYVVQFGSKVLAIEVKSGRTYPEGGLAFFKRRYPHARTLIVGAGGVSLEQFFDSDVKDWL